MQVVTYHAQRVASPILLRACYAMSGTDIAYGAMALLCDVRYWHGVCCYLPTLAMRCLVLTHRIMLRIAYAMYGTDISAIVLRHVWF
eukprot:35013-Rhodomonas_salina.1